MGRYDDDIPEVFRRAMEEAGWRGGDREQRPQSAHPRRPWWTNRWFWLVLGALILFGSFTWIVTTYTEWLWFTGVGYQDVWLRQWGAQIVSFLVFFIIAATFFLINWRLARRHALRPASAGMQILNLPGVGALMTLTALFLAFVMGQAAAVRWESFLRYIYRAPFGISDPIFNRDLGFYIFQLPVYQFVRGWFMPLIMLTLLGAVTLYVVNNLPSFQGRQLQLHTLPLALRRHSAILLGLFLLLWAVGYWFDLFGLLYSPQGVVFGAGYTDLQAVRPALWVQMVLMTVLAVAVLFLAWRPDPRPAVVATGLWLVATIGLAGIYPSILQRYAVEPNELARETPYIEHNIRFTRFGFDLDVETQTITPDDDITAQDLEDNAAALNNIRLWDYRPLLQTYSQLQELRPYYQFADVDIDRYEIDGELKQVMLSAREILKSGLSNPTWVNQRLEYTHGYGLVMNPVEQFTSQGRPVFYIQDLPPRSAIDLTVERPQIYYGELTNDIVHANSDLDEFDYPSGDENVYTNYAGLGGVPLDSWLKRLAFAIRFGDPNLILSDYITPQTRTLLHRQIQERVRQIAPFLWQDSDPYLVITSDGHLVWMLDTYTISDDLPYSQPFTPPTAVGADSAFTNFTVPSGINYVRNAVKVTIEAYDGTVNFYVSDPDDPIIQTYERAFPGMFQPFSAMPEDLYSHIRYPVDLFLIQTRQYLTYHIENVQVFYNEEDLWQIPNEIFDGSQQPIEPYYVIFSLPGEQETEFLLIQPYTPATRNNMIAWIAARNDPPHYGELQVYELPKQELVFGPIQIEGRIDQEPGISQQFTLWSQRGSRVIRGNLLVIPINNSFLYVEPIYLQSETSALPELRRVIVASGEAVVMRETLDEALTALLEAAPPVAEIVAEPPVEDAPPPDDQAQPPEDGDTVTIDAGIEDLIVAANQHYLAAETAQRNGDWAAYGREIEALQRSLQQLLEMTGGQLPATAP